MTGDRQLVLAVDGGQTSSKAIVATIDGEILGWGIGSACDHLHGPNGYERNRDAILSGGTSALAAAGRSAEEIGIVGLGLTSAPRESEILPLFHQMVREFCTPDSIWVDADFVSNLAGASGGQPGVVVIAGGGSIGYGVNASGVEAIAGGLGYLMGDEGSGWYFGLRAIQEAARGGDQRGPATALLPMVLEHYGIGSIREVIRLLYDRDFTRDQVANLAPQVLRVAAAGDEVAKEIVSTGARRLGEIALGTIRQLHLPGDPVSVFPTGGVFTAGPQVMTTFTSTIGEHWPTATVVAPVFPPVIGAYLMAMQTAAIPVTEAIHERLVHSIARRDTAR